VIDLFSGCGGLSLGFQKAGYDLISSIEIDQAALDVALYNLFWRYGDFLKQESLDVTLVESDMLPVPDREYPLVVVGGPPCQAYSMAGRAKLMSLKGGKCYTEDERGFLFEDFVRLSVNLDADAVIMENVPESVNFGGLNVPELVCKMLSERGFHAKWTVLNSADYGVPQARERVFVVGVKGEYFSNFKFPTPTHKSPVQELTNTQKRFSKFDDLDYFVMPNLAKSTLPLWNTVEDAISDLPSLFPTAKSQYRLYQPTVQLPYKTKASNQYQKLMRSWYGTETMGVTGHSFRRTIRDYPIFELMKEGDNFLDASLIADKLLEDTARIRGIREKDCPEAYNDLKKKIVPPYDRTKFLSKWKKLERNRPSHTLPAHLGVDSYSHIHPWEPRGISVREAARLQSFPDEFLFQTSMSNAFKQIGNSVPPLLANAIANSLLESLVVLERMAKNG